MVHTVTPHTVNGVYYGAWHVLPDGRGIYLAQRKKRDIYRLKYAWCLDIRTLEQTKQRGIKWVGVVVAGKDKLLYATPIEDFYDSPFSFRHHGATQQRGLPLARFRVNPIKSLERIAARLKLR